MHDEMKSLERRDLFLEAMERAPLNQNQRLLVSLQYFPGERWTPKEVGAILGLTNKTVRQIEMRSRHIFVRTMSTFKGNDLFVERFFALGNCRFSNAKQDLLVGFIERSQSRNQSVVRQFFFQYVVGLFPPI
jgi:hypothetical protein